MKNKKKLIIVLSLILFTLGCVCLTGVLVHKKEQQKIEKELQIKLEEEEKKKRQLTIEDFETGLVNYEYILLNGEIETNLIRLSIKNISEEDFSLLCNNINLIMNNFKETKDNISQTEFEFYIYDKTNNSTELSKANKIIKYSLNEDTYDIYYDIDIPSIKIADGLLPYEVISFTNNELLVSMNTENLTLYDKICQMKTLQEIVMSLNNLTKLDISLKENNIIYKYKNDSSIIEVIETINL